MYVCMYVYLGAARAMMTGRVALTHTHNACHRCGDLLFARRCYQFEHTSIRRQYTVSPWIVCGTQLKRFAPLGRFTVQMPV